MKLAPYLCLAGLEVVNGARTWAYGAHRLFTPCGCPALEDEVYVDPASDPAPWYDADHPESANFLGLLTSDITLSPPYARTATPLGAGGASVGSELMRGSVIDVVGWMIATDPQGMWWGERWLTETLRGGCGGCSTDDLILLPYCRDEAPDDDFSVDFRTMVGVGLVDGPRWAPVSDDECFIIQQAQFQLATAKPWLYSDAVVCMDAEITEGSALEDTCCMASTSQWPGDAALIVTVTATTEATDIVVENRVSFDGTCDNLQGMPCWRMEIPAIEAGGQLVFDGARENVRYIDPSLKSARSGVSLLSFDGPLTWPGVGPCTDLCVCASAGSGEVTVTVEVLNRES